MATPDGYQAPIHQALTRVFTLGGVPRQLLMATAMFCLGAGMVFRSWGVILVYVMAHVTMAYLTWRDPYWPQIAVEVLRYTIRVMTHRLVVMPSPAVATARRVLIVCLVCGGFGLLVLLTVKILVLIGV